MSFVDKLKQRMQDAKDAMLVPAATAEHRIMICKECPSLIQVTQTCKECGCFMAGKSKLVGVTCPLGKW